MILLRYMLARLPERWQKKLTVRLVSSGKEIAGLIGQHASCRVFPGEDHLCSNTIGSGLADDLFDCYAGGLTSGVHHSTMKPQCLAGLESG